MFMFMFMRLVHCEGSATWCVACLTEVQLADKNSNIDFEFSICACLPASNTAQIPLCLHFTSCEFFACFPKRFVLGGFSNRLYEFECGLC